MVIEWGLIFNKIRLYKVKYFLVDFWISVFLGILFNFLSVLDNNGLLICFFNDYYKS